MTPSTNRGVNFPDDSPIGLGWLSLTLRAHTETHRGRLINAVLEAVGEDAPRDRPHGIQGYPEAIDVAGASAVGWTPERPREVHITLKQRDCTWTRFGALLELAAGCESWKCSRLDLNYDDHTRAALPADVMTACAAGQAVTRVALDQVESIARNAIVESVYVGARASDRHLNVYDKDAEQSRQLREVVPTGTHGVRWELRLRDDRATATVRQVLGLPDVDELRQAFWSAVTSLIDFRERDREKRGHHVAELPRLTWFVALAGQLARQTSYLPRALEDADVRLWRLRRWLVRCAAAVAEVVERDPNPLLLREVVALGADRLTVRNARVLSRVAAA